MAEDLSGASDGTDPEVPHSARLWNYWIGGRHFYESDRAAGEAVRAAFPGIVADARHSRAFLSRAVRHLAKEAGVRQFLDLGSGLPAAGNTHEVAQREAPECRVVYVDSDPLVPAHAAELESGTPEGAGVFVPADVRDTGTVLAEAARTLDFDEPVALLMLGLLGNIPDYDEGRALVRRLLDAVPPGSHLVVNDGVDTHPERVRAVDRFNAGSDTPYTNRSPALIAGYFDGLEMLDPGLVPTSQWRPTPGGADPDEVAVVCGVGRKP